MSTAIGCARSACRRSAAAPRHDAVDHLLVHDRIGELGPGDAQELDVRARESSRASDRRGPGRPARSASVRRPRPPSWSRRAAARNSDRWPRGCPARTPAGKYSSSKQTRRGRSRVAEALDARRTAGPVARFSFRMRSSWAVAMPRRGPIRMRIRPRYRTGGESAGWTVMTATSPSSSRRLVTVIVGGGRMLPSVLMSAS